MPKVKLDPSFCQTAQCEEGKKRSDYYDTVTTGFILECRPNGGKTYYLRYFDASGRQRQIKLGGYADITFDQARRKARQLGSEVTLGGDPAVDKADKRAVPLYADLAAQHLAHAKTYLRRPADVEAILRLHIVPVWGKVRINEIKPQAIAAWLANKLEEGLAPATVEKIRVTFNRSFELAKKWNLPGAEVNPVLGVPRRKFNNARNRYLTAKEAERLRKAVAASENPQLKYIVGLLLLTGARRSELLKARWQHVDLERKAWLIPDSKTGKPRFVPLSQAAIDIIGQLPKWDGCPWLLPNPDTQKPFVTIKRAWATACRVAGLHDLHLHDLRHSAASFMINAGIDLYAVGKVLGHADHRSTMRYSHLSQDSLLKAVEAGAAMMQGGQA